MIHFTSFTLFLSLSTVTILNAGSAFALGEDNQDSVPRMHLNTFSEEVIERELVPEYLYRFSVALEQEIRWLSEDNLNSRVIENRRTTGPAGLINFVFPAIEIPDIEIPAVQFPNFEGAAAMRLPPGNALDRLSRVLGPVSSERRRR